MNKASPITLHAAPSAGFDEPFEMLQACHERVERMLGLLERLAAHLLDHGAEATAQRAAVDVMRYFDVAGPAHHEDEERHLFPRLLAQGSAELQQVVGQMQHDHRTYMDAPGLPSFQLTSALRKRLHPYIRTSDARRARCP